MDENGKDEVRDDERPLTTAEAIKILDPDEVIEVGTDLFSLLLLGAVLAQPRRPPVPPNDGKDA